MRNSNELARVIFGDFNIDTVNNSPSSLGFSMKLATCGLVQCVKSQLDLHQARASIIFGSRIRLIFLTNRVR